MSLSCFFFSSSIPSSALLTTEKRVPTNWRSLTNVVIVSATYWNTLTANTAASTPVTTLRPVLIASRLSIPINPPRKLAR